MTRLLALAAAVGMVVGALALRGDAPGRAGGDGGRGAEGPLRLTCAAELATACQALADGREDLQVTVEEAGHTADRLAAASAADVTDDGWMVPAPWPQLVEEARGRAGSPPLLDHTGPVLARTPLVVAVWSDRSEVLATSCQPDVGWRCIGEMAGRPWSEVGGQEAWGPVKPVVPDPVTTTVGLFTLGQATATYHGRADLSRADLDDDGYRDWLGSLAGGLVHPPDPSLQAMLPFGRARFDLVATTEASAQPLVERAARAEGLVLLDFEPVATADVVLATRRDDRRATMLADLVGGSDGLAALAGAGWRLAGDGPAATPRPGLPDGNGLPSPGVLEALRSAWQEVA
ncbi:MAG TPA: hypothetical protein VHF25_16840 [Nitriliruptorales bacterium]|nr:hypothetical protein [Nitriliruptorales bacterium]